MSISIHAPRAGSDRPPHQQPPSVLYFNPCSPCGERLSVIQFLMPTIQFQSMLPVRGATKNQVAHDSVFRISIHAPRAGSDGQRARGRGTPSYFNPCSPCGERLEHGVFPQSAFRFQSMLPVRGATGQRESVQAGKGISIHAPRAGSDLRDALNVLHLCNFNPCSPCGERLPACRMGSHYPQFQSMLPVRGATLGGCEKGYPRRISIHAPRAGSDICLKAFTFDGYNFNPCSPCGERLRFAENQQICFLISIHAPRAGSDYLQVLLPHQPRQFQSMLPVRGATFLPLCQGT